MPSITSPPLASFLSLVRALITLYLLISSTSGMKAPNGRCNVSRGLLCLVSRSHLPPGAGPGGSGGRDGACFEAPGPKHQFLAMATIQAPAPYPTSPMEWASKSSGRTLPGFCFHKPQALCDFQPQAGLSPQIPEPLLSPMALHASRVPWH